MLTSHYWGRVCEGLGLKTKLIAPQFVEPFRKSQKNDVNDAKAICEAARRPDMRFVSIKSEEKLQIQALHRARELLIKQQTSLINQMRGFLAEQGIVIPKSKAQFFKFMKAYVLKTSGETILDRCLFKLWNSLQGVAADIVAFDREILRRRLRSVTYC